MGNDICGKIFLYENLCIRKILETLLFDSAVIKQVTEPSLSGTLYTHGEVIGHQKSAPTMCPLAMSLVPELAKRKKKTEERGKAVRTREG